MRGFKQYAFLSEYAMDINAGLAFINANTDIGPLGDLQAQSPTFDPRHPMITGLLPTTTRRSTIKYLNEKSNPIFLHLEDGTQLFFPLDAFNKIKGERPEVGKTLTIIFQRRPDDKTRTPSKIESVECY